MGASDKKNNNKQSIFTKETLGVVLVLFSTLCVLCLITGDKIFSVPGKAVCTFLFGCFGYFAFLLCAYGITKGVMLITDKKFTLSKKRKALIITFFVVTALLCHVISMHNYSELAYGKYLSQSYLMAEGGLATCSGGGVVTGLIAYLVSLILTNVGGYVVLGVAITIIVFLFVRDCVKENEKIKTERSRGFNSSYVKSNDEVQAGVNPTEERDYPVEGVFDKAPQGSQKLFILDDGDFALKTNKDYKQEAKAQSGKYSYNQSTKLFEEKRPVQAQQTYSKAHDKAMQDKLNYIKTPARLTLDNFNSESSEKNQNSVTISDAIRRSEDRVQITDQSGVMNTQPFNSNEEANSAESHAEAFSDKYLIDEVAQVNTTPAVEAEEVYVINEGRGRSLNIEDIPFIDETESTIEEKNEITETVIEDGEKSGSGLFAFDNAEEEPTPSVVTGRRARDIFFEETPEEKEDKTEGIKDSNDSELSLIEQLNRHKEEQQAQAERLREEQLRAEIEEKKQQVILPPVHVPYVAPKLDLLFDYEPDEDQPKENHEEKMNIIINTLESFKIKAEAVDYIQGPTVTRYELRMPVGTPVTSVLKYDNDLKMWLSSKEGVMIQAPIPGKGLIGVEVANQSRVKVGLKEIMQGLENKKHKEDTIYFALGKDVVGNPVEDDLSKGPHYLVAGTTGSGKSVCLNIMITSMIMRYSPEDVRFILVDPKHVDYAVYEHLPHLLVDEIIDKPEKVVAALTWLYEESERRFEVFKQAGGYAKIEEYNKYVACDTIPKMPRIVMVIDEVADLMQNYKKEMESKIAAIAQKARAAGVHLILATQYPRGDIISTPIKANLPGRIALRVTSGSASQLMLSQPGAEKLLGYGDMLYRNNFMSEPERYQGGIIELEEIKNIVKDIIANNKAYFDRSLTECLAQVDKPQDEPTTYVEATTSGIDSAENNDLFVQALALAIENGTISISYLQRHFQIGYARAGGLIDKMERKGYISGNEGSKGRKVYITKEEFLEKFGPNSEDSIV